MLKKTIQDVDISGKRVLLRVDFNVPLSDDGTISDDTRITACLPTINYLIDRQSRIIICSHLGRPHGKIVEQLRMAPVAQRLSKLLGKPVEALEACIGPDVEAAVAKLKDGDILFLENVRFYPGEEANDPNFAHALARLADIYVNDAFGVSHRAHASIVGVAKYLPALSGFLMSKELRVLGQALENPERPFAAMIGGAKVSGKLEVLENIVTKVNSLLIGGGLAATFLKVRGYAVGASLVGDDKLDYVENLMKNARSLNVKLLLPQDVVVADKLEAGSKSKTVLISEIPDGWIAADIGPKTIEKFSKELTECKTVVWNGPLGVFEIPQFAEGTRQLAQTIAGLKTTTIIGGGSTAEAVAEMGLAGKMYHVSTGGGASLDFLAGKTLPGVAVLQDK